MNIIDISTSDLESLRTRARDIKLMATDLDGTLLDSTHAIREETRRALSGIVDKGIILAVATGRARSSIPETVVTLPGMKYLVTANGAKVFLNETNELVHEDYMNPDVFDFIRPFLRDPEVMVEVFWDGVPHVEESKYNAAREYGIPKWFSEYFFNSRSPVNDFENIVSEHMHEMENINFIFANEEVQTRVYNFLASGSGLYELTSSFPFNYEIGGIGVSKGAAVDIIARREGISSEEVISFGDQDNDVTMIEYAGIGVATANAAPRAYAAADLITHDNENEGVAAALKLLELV